jgi:hypothetical protein
MNASPFALRTLHKAGVQSRHAAWLLIGCAILFAPTPAWGQAHAGALAPAQVSPPAWLAG